MQSKKLVKELTPDAFMCVGGPTCPSVFETAEGTLLVIGKTVTADRRGLLPAGRVGDDETVIEIPRGLVADIEFSKT